MESSEESKDACRERGVGGVELSDMRETHIGFSYHGQFWFYPRKVGRCEVVNVASGNCKLTFRKAAMLASAFGLAPVPPVSEASCAIGIL